MNRVNWSGLLAVVALNSGLLWSAIAVAIPHSTASDARDLAATASSLNRPAFLLDAFLLDAGRFDAGRLKQGAGQPTAADRLLLQGNQQFQQGNLQAAQTSWLQALALYRQQGDRPGEANTLGNLGSVSYFLGDYEQAIAFQQQALDLKQAINADRGFTVAGQLSAANTLNNLGTAYRALGQYQQAIAYHQQALTLTRDRRVQTATPLESRFREAGILNNLGFAYASLSQQQQAIALYQQALAINRDPDIRATFPRESLADEAIALSNLGNAYYALGSYSQALTLHQESLAIKQSLGDRRGAATTLGNLGNVHAALGQYPQAIDFYQQHLTLARRLGDRQGEISALGNLGTVYDTLGQTQPAIAAYQQSLAIARDIGDRQGEAAALGNLGVIYRAAGDYPQAIAVYQQALEIARTTGDRQIEAITLASLGNVYYALGEDAQAIDLHQQSLEIARTIGDRQGEATALQNLGTAFLASQQLTTAETALRQSLEIYESLRVDLTDAQLIAIADTQAQAYSTLEMALITQGKTAEALVISERSRAQAFALRLALRSRSLALVSGTGLSGTDLSGVDLSGTDLSGASLSGTGLSGTGLSGIGVPATAPVTTPTLADIQRIAQEHQATLVEYSFSPAALHIWVVQPDGAIQFRTVALADRDFDAIALADASVRQHDISNVETGTAPITPASPPLDARVAAARRGLGIVSGTDRTPETSTQGLQDLHQLLIAPIADLLPQDANANVVFIPQGSLFLIPFAALQAADGTYLIENHTVSTVPSIQVLDLATRNHSGLGDLNTLTSSLIVGNPTMPQVSLSHEAPPSQLSPLPGAEAEALDIATLLNTSPLIGDQATEARIKHQMPTAQLIHLATHGLLNYGGSPQSVPGAVALAPSNGEDGLLTANEILEMDLQAQLAILSACDTGLGRITGDGVVGLSRALITAGVPSVIVSLWAVPDAPTAALMTEFYQQLNRDQSPSQALRQAMLLTLNHHPDPRSWAAFTLIGVAH